MMEVRGKRVLVVGLARSGQAAAFALRRHGAIVTVTDLRPPHEFRHLLPELLAQKIGIELGCHREEGFLRQDMVVVSPGVPWDLPQLEAARKRDILIVPEVEAASWFLDGKFVGVTGSNGKTTTVTLLGKILEASGLSTFVGGNVGTPLSSAPDDKRPGTIFVTELSSFQLEAIQDFRPYIAVFLNLSPNHLDRHPSFEAYAQAKRQIFRNQKGEDYAVLNADDPWVRNLAPVLASRVVFFSRRRSLPSGLFVSNGHIVYRVGNLERVLLEAHDITLRGTFNLENVLAASAAACLLGVEFETVRNTVRAFKGVEHRLEYVAAIRGVHFYNNSKATSVDATLKSLEAFEGGVHLIMGGKDKGASYTPLIPLVKERVRDVLVIGAAAARITKELSGTVELIQAGDLETAVPKAFSRARPGDVVLLAPACSSFDQFQNFEHRGRVFKELVHRLAQKVQAGELEEGKRIVALPSGLRAADAAEVAPATAPEVVPAEVRQKPSAVVLPVAEAGALGTVGSVVEAVAPSNAAASAAEPPTVEHATPALAVEASDVPPAVKGPVAEGPRHLELVYVYEVDAEEMPPGDVEPASQSDEETELGSPERAEDEPLPFETRPPAKGGPLGGEERPPLQAASVSGDSKSKTKVRGKVASEGKSQPAGAGQPRLPGIE